MPIAADPQLEPIPQPVTDDSADAPQLVSAYPPRLILAKDTERHPDVPRPELLDMTKRWRIGDILLGGIEAILKHADEMLPALGSDEEPTERASRLRKAINTPFYSDTIERLVARPFGRPVSFRGSQDTRLPEGLRHLERNADGAGKSLSAVLRDHLFEAIHRGGHCLLVDLPSQDVPTSAAQSLGRRPIVKSISLQDILGWDFEADDEGQIKTTGLRLWECNKRASPLGWGERVVRGVRVMRCPRDGQPGYSVLYEQQDNGDWLQVAQAPLNSPHLMLHTTWTQQLTATSGSSPMTHLAELNRAYIMGDCEQQYGASFARLMTLWTKGIDQGENKGKLGANVDAMSVRQDPPKRVTRGQRRHIRLPETASIGLLEAAGSGLSAARVELEGLEKRAQQFGAAHLSSQHVTATAVSSDDDRDTSNLRSWVGRVESTADNVLADCAELAGIELGEDFATAIFRDWSQATEREQATPHVFNAYDRTLVPARVVHDALRRYGVLTDRDSSEDLLAEAREEAEERGNQEADRALEAALRAAKGDADAEEGPADPSQPGSKAGPTGQPAAAGEAPAGSPGAPGAGAPGAAPGAAAAP